MSWIQQLEEEQYDTQTEWLNVMRQESIDHFADEQEYYCEAHDYADYENQCPYCDDDEVEEEPTTAIDPNVEEPPF